MNTPQRPAPRAFTLIELLIVVAIIAILAAIAVPNFLEAQTRAKISRVKADFRTIGTALETYMVDQNHYPIGRAGTTGRSRPGNDEAFYNLNDLTTPVAYLTAVPWRDPFTPSHITTVGSFTYFSYAGLWGLAGPVRPMITQAYGWPSPEIWAITSYGPDRTWQAAEWFPILVKLDRDEEAYRLIYDASNGTVSNGSIARFGGSAEVGSMGD